MKAAFTVHQSRAPPAGLLGRAMLSLLSTLRLLRCTHAGGAHERRRRAAAAALR
jgi:hypothetical protein